MGILSKVFSPVGDILNGLTGASSQTDEQYKMMKKQNEYNTVMWNLQNEYNSPASQLARMREAGVDINPTSYALGTGNISNIASNVSSASGFVGSPAGNPISMLMGMAQGIQGVRESKARTDNIKQEKFNIEARGTNEVGRGNVILAQAESARLNNDIARHNLAYARRHDKPVGYVPGVVNDPIGYAGGYAGDALDYYLR